MISALRLGSGAVMALLASLLLGSGAGAQTHAVAPTDPATVAQIRQWNGECFACHAPSALHNPPRPGLDLERLSRMTTHPARFDQSNHAGLACRTCHLGGLRGYPHSGPEQAVPGRSETLPCAECHAQQTWHIEAQAARSVHSRNLSDRFTCSTCHNPHEYATASRIRDPQRIVAQDNGMCLSCHDWDQRYAEFGGTLSPARRRPLIDQTHSWLPNPRRHWAEVRCIECHTPASPTRSLAVSHEILSRQNATRDCVACHSRDSTLRTGLYRYVAETQVNQFGFLNSALVDRAYVIGATRNTYIDHYGTLLLLLVIGGVALHGAIRFLAALLRGRQK